ncbi:hypothetical protein [Paracraurococcus ruber]|uniref:Lipoprotein n=1 Tax=Paracraurococcus ruber TaxID=77675 RepID=A0ABS1D680_9PROT|nr:hypothetical protein [Paracraurococcus ruber]MBK1661998.1 hypothetical protein [Paracraurococcus ruber]TDG28314.1 hypothetical protein E2C05_20835 [Paracraurococcus ruber]
MPSRRVALLLPLALPPFVLGACGGPEPAFVPPGPMRFGHLTPLPLNVAAVEVLPGGPPPQAGDIGARLAPSPAEAVRIMGQDRLLAVGTAGEARFAVTQAALVQGRDSLTCLVGCRLEILSPAGERQGFVEAQSRRAVSGREAERPRAAEALLRNAMDDLNVEFEFQLRRALRDWLVRVVPGPDGTLPAPAQPGVAVEELPKL